MSFIDVKDNGATPSNPPSGYLRIYPQGSSWKYVDSAGTVYTFSTGVTPEEVQDIVGAFFADSSTINVTYNDAGDVISADVIASAVNHNGLLNYVANQHVDHSSVSVNAGTGLTGGGDLTATRTISMPNTGTAGTYKSVTTDAQGRVTAGTNPTTLAGYGITDAQPLDADLTALSGLTGSGIVVRTGAGTATTRFIAVSTGLFGSAVDGVSGNPTIGIGNTGVTAATYQSPNTITSFAVNAQGQITGTTNNFIAIPPTQVTGFDEAAQDAVGGILTDSPSVDFTYSDGGNSIQAFVLPAGVDHNSLANLSAGDPHTQYLLESAAASTYETIASLPSDVRSTVLTGFSATPDSTVLATDQLLAAIGKLQAQIDRLTSEDNNWQEETKTADTIVSSNVTLTNITDLGISVVSGTTYYVEYTLLFRTAATTTGFSVSVGTTDTAAGEFSFQVNMPIAADGTAALYTGSIISFADVVTSTGVQTSNPTWFICTMRGIFRCTTTGTLVPQFRSEVNGSNVNCGQGSTVLARGF